MQIEVFSGDRPRTQISFQFGLTIFCTALKCTEICCLWKYLGGTIFTSIVLVGVVGEARDIFLSKRSCYWRLFGGQLVRREFVDWKTLEWDSGGLNTTGEGTFLGSG